MTDVHYFVSRCMDRRINNIVVGMMEKARMKRQVDVPWSDTSAKILFDIHEAVLEFEGLTGSIPTHLFVSKGVYDDVIKNIQIRDLISFIDRMRYGSPNIYGLEMEVTDIPLTSDEGRFIIIHSEKEFDNMYITGI